MLLDYKQGRQRYKLPSLVSLLKKNPKFVNVELLVVMAKRTLFTELSQEMPELIALCLRQQTAKGAPPLNVKETVAVFSWLFQYELHKTQEPTESIEVLEKHLRLVELREIEFKEKAVLVEESRRKITSHFLKHAGKLTSSSVVPAIITELVKQEHREK